MIDKKQYICMSYFLTRLLFIGGIFNLLFKCGQQDLLFSSIMGMLLGYFILFIFYKKGNINKNISVITAMIILPICLLFNTLLTSNFLLHETPTIIINIFLLIAFSYGSRKSLSNIFNSSQILFIMTIFIIAFCYLGLFKAIKISNLLPFFSTKYINVIKSILVFSSSSLIPNLLIINYKKDLSFKDVSKGYILGSISLIGIIIVIETIYGYKYASFLSFPEYMVLKRISFMNYINNIENILVMEWIVNIVIGCIICSYVIYSNVGKYLYYFIIIIEVILVEILYSCWYDVFIIIRPFIWYLYVLLILLCLITKKES